MENNFNLLPLSLVYNFIYPLNFNDKLMLTEPECFFVNSNISELCLYGLGSYPSWILNHKINYNYIKSTLPN